MLIKEKCVKKIFLKIPTAPVGKALQDKLVQTIPKNEEYKNHVIFRRIFLADLLTTNMRKVRILPQNFFLGLRNIHKIVLFNNSKWKNVVEICSIYQ